MKKLIALLAVAGMMFTSFAAFADEQQPSLDKEITAALSQKEDIKFFEGEFYTALTDLLKALPADGEEITDHEQALLYQKNEKLHELINAKSSSLFDRVYPLLEPALLENMETMYEVELELSEVEKLELKTMCKGMFSGVVTNIYFRNAISHLVKTGKITQKEASLLLGEEQEGE